MRRLAFLAAVLLGLAGCAVKEEGRECQGHSDCPNGQACGASGTCTKAAAACGDQRSRPLCTVGARRCVGGDTALEECKADDRGEECASFVSVQACSGHQSCGPRPGDGALACNCEADTCSATRQKYCDTGSGELVTCEQEAGTGCWFSPPSAACDAGMHCNDDGTTAACACDDTACVDGTSTFCQANNERVVCSQDPATLCWAPSPPASCGTVRTCTPHTGGATCDCPLDRCTSTATAFCAPGGGIVTCASVDGCTVEQPAAGCGDFRQCTGPDGSAACTCVADGGCAEGVASICNAQRQVVTCEKTNGCNHPAATGNDCPAHQACQAGAGAEGACTCIDDRCAGTVRSFCDGGKLVTCDRGGSCPFENPPADCPDAGQSCTETSQSPRTASCQCPVSGPGLGQGCSAGDLPSCSGSTVLVCAPKVAGSNCFVWTQDITCGTGLSCSAGACVCPDAVGGEFFADSILGTASPPPPGAPAPTGAETPAACRYASIEVALARANAVLPSGGTVRATGATGLAPMTFVLTGTLAVATGVTVTTTDAPLGTANYELKAPPTFTPGQALITLAAGASLSGFHVLNDGATGPAVQTSCAVGVTDPVLVDTVKISGAGTATNRFSAGLSQASPDCPVTLRNADVQGVGHGLDLTAGSLAVEGGAFAGNVSHVRAHPTPPQTISLTVVGATMTGATDSAVVVEGVGAASTVVLQDNNIIANSAATDWSVGTQQRRGGGVVFTAPLPGLANNVFKGNTLSGNSHDQVLVAASSGDLNLTGAPTLQECSATPRLRNVFRCYYSAVGPPAYAGVGVYAGNATVRIDFNEWTNQPPVLGTDYFGGSIVGNNNSCLPNLPPTCP